MYAYFLDWIMYNGALAGYPGQNGNAYKRVYK